MKSTIAFAACAAAATALLAAPVFAAPPAAKRPLCQARKVAIPAKRADPCRRSQGIPPVIDPTPLFLASTAPASLAQSDLS